MNEYVKFLIVCIALMVITGAVIWIGEKISLTIYKHRQKKQRQQQKAHSRKISNSKNR